MHTIGLHTTPIGYVQYSDPSILRPPMGPEKMWSYIASGLKIRVIKHKKNFGDQIKWFYNQGWS